MRGNQAYDLTEATPAYQSALDELSNFMQARPFGIGPTNHEILQEYWTELNDAAEAGEPKEEIDRIGESARYKTTIDIQAALVAEVRRRRGESLKPTDHLLYTDKTKPLDPWARMLDERNYDRADAKTLEEKLAIEKNYQELAQIEGEDARKEREEREGIQKKIAAQRERGVFGSDAKIVEINGERVVVGPRHEVSAEDYASAERASRAELDRYDAADDPFIEEFHTAEEEDAAREAVEQASKEEREGFYESGD